MANRSLVFDGANWVTPQRKLWNGRSWVEIKDRRIMDASPFVDVPPIPPAPPGVPTFSPQPGVYTDSVTVAITPFPGSVARFTIDGTAVTESSPAYTSPLLFTTSTLLRAKCFNDEGSSPEVQGQYFVSGTPPPPPPDEPPPPPDEPPPVGEGTTIMRVNFENADYGTYEYSDSEYRRHGFIGKLHRSSDGSSGLTKGRRHAKISDDPLGQRGKVLECIIPKECCDSTEAPYMDWQIAHNHPNADDWMGWGELWLSYWILFNKDWQWNRRGGKMGWHLAGANPGRGEPPKHCSSDNRGFSARTMWYGPGSGSSEGVFGFYLYDYDKDGRCGDSYKISGRTFYSNRWYHVMQHIVCKDSSRDSDKARYELYIDGQLKRTVTGRKMSDGSHRINWLRLETYFGGGYNEGYGHSRDESVYFDDIRLWIPASADAEDRGEREA